MSKRPILERLAAELATLETRTKGRRRPKAFYLTAEDWAEFEATKPPTIRVTWGNNPPKGRDDLAFRDIPVLPSSASISRLYDHTTTGRPVA